MKRLLTIIILFILSITTYGQLNYCCFKLKTYKIDSSFDKLKIIFEDSTFIDDIAIDEMEHLSGYYSKRPILCSLSKHSDVSIKIGGLSHEISNKLVWNDNENFVNFQYHIYPIYFKIKEELKKDHYCINENIRFWVSNPNNDIFSVYFRQNNKKYYYSHFSNEEFEINYDKLSENIDPKEEFTIIVVYNDLEVSDIIKPVFKNIDFKATDFSLVDNTLYLPELSSTQSISMFNLKTGHFDDIVNNVSTYDLGNKYGYYELKVEGTGTCPVTFNLVHPKLTLNEVVKNSGNQFWYPGEERKDVLNLTLYSLDNSQIGNYKADELTFEPKMDFWEGDSEWIYVQNPRKGEEEDSAQYNSSIYSLVDYTDELLDTISITSTNPNFIPVTKTFKLNSYQKINVADVEVADPICYYDSAEVNIGNISEGLKEMI